MHPITRGHLGTDFVLGARPRPSERCAEGSSETRAEPQGEGWCGGPGEAGGGSAWGSLPHPASPGGRYSGETPPLPTLGLRSPPAPPRTAAGASRARAPRPEKNQTASQPIGEEMGQPWPMAAANTNER